MLNYYLEKLSNSLIISNEEKIKIKHALDLLEQKVIGNLADVSEHFCFGSYMRDTNLPNLFDPKSDIDYLVVFKKPQQIEPNDLCKKLENFVENQFAKEDIEQLTPTCVVRIDGFRFELIPAYRNEKYFVNYKIPTDQVEWVETVPNGFNDYLLKLDAEHDSNIIPIIRILKYWNIKNGSPYTSYHLENIITFLDIPRFDQLVDYLYYIVENLSTDHLVEDLVQVVNRLKQSIMDVKNEESKETALHKLSLIFPYQ